MLETRLHSNRPVQMISSALYERLLPPYERYLAGKMQPYAADEISKDTEGLLRAFARAGNVGVCCINMDFGTPHKIVNAIFEASCLFAA